MKWSKPPFSAASIDQVDGRHGPLGGVPSTSVMRRPGPEVGHVALLEEDDPVGVGEDGRDVAGQEGLAVRQPDDEGHVHAGADEPVGSPRCMTARA